MTTAAAPTVAIVDDELAFALSFADDCRDALDDGHVVICTGGREIIGLLPALRRRAVIVLDLILDRESGLSLLADIRRRAPDAAVLMVSQHRAEEPRFIARRLGAVAFEDKPRSADDQRCLAASVARFAGMLGDWRELA